MYSYDDNDDDTNNDTNDWCRRIASQQHTRSQTWNRMKKITFKLFQIYRLKQNKKAVIYTLCARYLFVCGKSYFNILCVTLFSSTFFFFCYHSAMVFLAPFCLIVMMPFFHLLRARAIFFSSRPTLFWEKKDEYMCWKLKLYSCLHALTRTYTAGVLNLA